MNPQLESLQRKWNINKVHFKDLNLSNICKNKALVLNDMKNPVMITFYHVMKIKDNLFILHDHLEHQHKAGNDKMTVSHLKTGQALLHFTMKPGEKIPSMEERASECLEAAINKFGMIYAMERIKSAQSINMKYNIYGY